MPSPFRAGWRWPAAWNPRRSLRARFALLLGASGLAFALLAALVVDRYERAQLLDSLGQAMRREALLLSRSLNLALQDRLQQLREVASLPLLSSGLMEPGDMRLLLEDLRTQQPALAWAAITDEKGRVMVATNTLLEGRSVADEPWFAQASKAPWIGSRRPAGALTQHLGLSAGAAPTLIDLGVPLLDSQGRIWGVLTARLRWDWLEGLHAAMQAPDRRLPGSDSLVLDREDRVLIGPPARLDQPLSLPGFAELRAGATPRLLAWPGEGEFVTAAGRDAGEGGATSPGLTVLVRQPANLAFMAADELRQRLLIVGLLATLVFAALSAWLGRRVALPIRALADEAGRVGQGQAPDFSGIAPRRDDEVARLARKLTELHTELERRLLAQQLASERYEALFRTAPVAVYFNVDTKLQLANSACLQLFGARELSQLQGKTYHDLYHPDDHELLARRRQQRMQQKDAGQPLPMVELRIIRLDGTVAYVEQTAMALTVGEASGVQLVLRDVTEQRRAQALLALREAQLTQTSRMAKVGGWQMDLATQQASWTDEMASIYEVAPDTVPTVELALSYFRGEDHQRLKSAIGRALRSGTPYDLELQLTTPQGRVKWVRAQARVLMQDGKPVRLEGITQDITERRAAQEALQQLNAELERRVNERTAELQAANAELDSFAYAVSHDLRAPLRAMSGFSQALVEDHGAQLDGEARAYLDEIVKASERMGGLIDGLLALSRSLRGALRADEVDLSLLATRCIDELRRGDTQRQVDVHIEPGMLANGDRRMLDAVVNNLLGNAWKYSAHTPHARIEFTRQTRDGSVWFCLKDNGAGFDMAHAGRLFKAFARLHRQDEFPGIGIGLATVQRIIHRHGGQIVADASPGQGATFRFTLPARQTGEPTDSSSR